MTQAKQATHPFYPAGHPRFNHVALSLPAELLGEEGRRELCHFFNAVLGFEELPTMTEDGKRLVLSCVHWDQFIYLVSDEHPMKSPRMDHFGFSVGSMEDLRGIQERAEKFRAEDGRLDVIDLHADDQTVVTIHSLYLRFLLPMTCEFQYWEFAP